MPRDRIVFETSSEKKEALQDKLSADGVTLSDWLGDQLELMLGRMGDDSPSYPEIETLAQLADPEAVADALAEINWAFADEDTRYHSHDLHPYPAKFIPQIPGHLISQLSRPGELVFDPFGGSGTAALEAARLGRRAISLDANPLAELIGSVKTAFLDRSTSRDLRSLRASVASQLQDRSWSSECLLDKCEEFVPDIPNMEKWFPVTSRGELAWVCTQINGLQQDLARKISKLALSKIILGASFQDSETRYASKPREIPARQTLQAFLSSLDNVTEKVARSTESLQQGHADFITGDSRQLLDLGEISEDSVDLVVTSPPYGNAMDYHLYHRFRLFWLGYDPRDLSQIEIGSHLRHQREGTGFSDYVDDLSPVLEQLLIVLRPGRYAAFVIGDSVYDGETYDAAAALNDLGDRLGWNRTATIPRELPEHRRSFSNGRRATGEEVVVLRKPPRSVVVQLQPPNYQPWDYELELRRKEVEALLGSFREGDGNVLEVELDGLFLNNSRRLAFTSIAKLDTGNEIPTWQHVLENGFSYDESSRKDPKYVTHGVHSYKGKFYPQLAKALLNLPTPEPGQRLLDPFCGSGTSLLEGRLNGWESHGLDLNPLAAQIARAKVGILDLDPRLVSEVFDTVTEEVSSHDGSFSPEVTAFKEEAIDEIRSWFPEPVVYKLNWLLKAIRKCSAGVLQEYLEVIVSSLVRDVSHQDPRDLRIRRRKEPLDDADVLGRFLDALGTQTDRLQKWWLTRGHCPYHDYPATVVEGDSRSWEDIESSGVDEKSVDLVLTSPPYATALPYVDTDRLSLLVLHGMTSSQRRPLEKTLTGSREILKSSRDKFEEELDQGIEDLPASIVEYIEELFAATRRSDVGFRRRNRPALLVRFFRDLVAVFGNCHRALKNGGECFIIIGDNTTTLEGEKWCIPTSRFTHLIAESVGFEPVEEIPISVTTEDMKHVRHAITENTILRLRRR